MEIEIIPVDFTVCKVKDYSEISPDSPFVFTGSTDEERSLVCPTDMVPSDTLERSDGWKAFRIVGVLDLSLVGILSKISSILVSRINFQYRLYPFPERKLRGGGCPSLGKGIHREIIME